MQSFAELTSREKSIEVMRWVVVVPAAWVAAMAVPLVVGFLRPRVMALPPGMPRPPVSDFQRIFVPHMLGIVMAAVFVIVGAKIAPRWRVPVAGMLAVLWVVLSYLVHIGPHASLELRYLIYALVAATGAIGAFIYVWSSERRNALEPTR